MKNEKGISLIILVLIIVAFMLLGILFVGVLKHDDPDNITGGDIFLAIFWPLSVGMLMIFTIIKGVFTLGVKIGDLFEGKE